MNLKGILLSEISQTEKDKYWILPFPVLFLKFLFLFEIILKQKVIFFKKSKWCIF